jgi:AcrR family transcriptional regulator
MAEAAGVSRGALTHHFRSREDLIAAAVEHMLLIAIEELRSFTRGFIARNGSSDDIVDFLWDLMNRRLFLVTLEIMLEARHNPAFLDSVRPVVREWHQALDTIWNQLAERYRVEPEFARALMNGTLCLIRGMIAQSIIRVDPAYYAGLLDFWKKDVRAQFSGTKPGTVVPLDPPSRSGR